MAMLKIRGTTHGAKIRLFAALALGALLAADALQAEIIRYAFSGVVEKESPVFGALQPGDRFEGSFSFDADPATNPDDLFLFPEEADIGAYLWRTFEIEGRLLQHSTSDFDMVVLNDFFGVGEPIDGIDIIGVAGDPETEGEDVPVYLIFRDESAGLFDSDALSNVSIGMSAEEFSTRALRTSPNPSLGETLATIDRLAVAPHLTAPGGPAAMPLRFRGLGHLPGYSPFSTARAISADGKVIVGWCGGGTSGSPPSEAFRWTAATGMVGLGHLPAASAPRSLAYTISADGDQAFGNGANAIDLGSALRWSQADGWTDLGALTGGSAASINAASADGSVLAGSSKSAEGFEAFRWTPGSGMTGLGDLPGGAFSSAAYGISADGTVIVGASISASGGEAFRWTAAGGMTGLGDLPGGRFNSRANAVSGDGLTIVGRASPEPRPEGPPQPSEAIVWTAASGMVGLGDLPGGEFWSEALAVSADGSVVVGSATADRSTSMSTEAFIWTSFDGMRSVRELLAAAGMDLEGWQLWTAQAVSADGNVIAGEGVNPQGNREAWMASGFTRPHAPLPSLELLRSAAGLRLRLTGVLGSKWIVEQSPSLAGVGWQPIATVTLESGAAVVPVSLLPDGHGYWRVSEP